MDSNNIIRFDWAAKRMLRDKANYAVLEGLVTVLLGEKITIVEILESESNQDKSSDKFNRVDIKAKDSKDEIILIEIQLTREWYYLQRVLYGVSKAITEHISLGSAYKDVKKVYSINILYFDLGKGSDYLYHGTTTFVGVHTKDELLMLKRDKKAITEIKPSKFFPEYYLIRVNEFNKIAKTPIEEWLDFLKNNHIKDDTQTPGLREAKEQLRIMQMNDEERRAYDDYLDTIRTQDSVLETYRIEGHIEGLAEGMEKGLAEGREKGLAEGREKGLAEGREKGIAEGRAEGRAEGERDKAIAIALEMKKLNISIEVIKQTTGLSETEINSIFSKSE